MKILFLTPGTGSYYCGACMRDNILARELLRLGHEVTIAPMYLPLMIDDTQLPGLEQTPIFFGGINVYLQQKVSLFRKTPAFFDKFLNARGLLRWAARHSHMTSAREHGEMTLEMLDIESAPFNKESEKLFSWLERSSSPDLVCLSNALLAGFAPDMRRRLSAPVITFFQGEDSFLDGLPDPWKTQCWTRMAQRLADSNARLAPSQFYADFMRERLAPNPGAIEVVPNGIRLEDFPVGSPPAQPTIGYFARITRDKGAELFVEAFIHLATSLGDKTTRARIGGAATAGDQPLIDTLQRRLISAGLADRVTWSLNIPREEKLAFLQSLSLFSVPVLYREAFGLYTIEAMACGIPIVQPEASAFPEIVAGGGGLCVPPKDARALAAAWQSLLADEPRRRALGMAARLDVEKRFSSQTMAAQFLAVAERLRIPA